MMNKEEILLAIVRLGIGHSTAVVADYIDWNVIQVLAKEQGLNAIMLDGIEELQKQGAKVVLPEKSILTKWIGEVLQGYEYRYVSYKHVIAEMADFYNSHGCKMMILKGFSCSLNWPKPEHRPIGDIDIWLFGDYKKADALLTSKKGIEVDISHHHHTVFFWKDFMVENHYDFINIHHHKSNVELEKEFKKLGKDDTHFIEVFGEKVYLPSPNLHALFLLKHMMNDFTGFSMTLRQLIDWAFHIEKFGDEIDWEWLKNIVEKYHMADFYNSLNAICVEDLGFDASIFRGVQFKPDMKERVLDDILHPKYSVREPSRLMPRLLYKYRRWKGNAWKHKMCYNESMWNAFWSGVWGHLLKPKSI